MADAVLTLPDILDTGSFEAARDALLAAPQTDPLRIDGAKVERITTPGAQLLTAFLAKNKKASLATPSPTLRAAWNDLGLATHFPFKE